MDTNIYVKCSCERKGVTYTEHVAYFYVGCGTIGALIGAILALGVIIHHHRHNKTHESRHGFTFSSNFEQSHKVPEEYYDNRKSVDGSSADFKQDKGE